MELHQEKLNARRSSIYKNAPRFSIFGVGDYSFSPWKVVISGLYKNIWFNIVGTYKGKPVVLDDTCYFLGFSSEEKARFIHKLLSSDIAKKFISSVVFTDNKRPITVAILNRISLKQLAIHLKKLDQYETLFEKETSVQMDIFSSHISKQVK